MPAALPPMTTRQAKRLGKNTVGQFRYTASQMRRADRREELEDRRRKEEEKERKKRDNKRKRDEQEEKERSAKRRLLREGKIAEEDTWGKVTGSQPRLNTFFKTPGTVKKPRKEDDDHGCDSQEDTLVDNAPMPQPELLETELECISDSDLLQLASSQIHSNPPTPPQSFEDRTSIPKMNPTNVSRDDSASTKMSKRRPSPSPHHNNKRQTEDEFEDESFSDFDVVEDETAEKASKRNSHINLNSPSASASRCALSEMSVANVNTRASDKPDTTSAPPDDCGLQSPPSRRGLIPDSTQNVLAMMADEEFDDDDHDSVWDKENTDPLDTPRKEKSKSATATPMKSSAKDRPESSKKPATPGFGKFEDCEDIFDFDFDTNDDFPDDEVDDATLMTMAATQKPKSDVIISVQGSPRKLSPMRDSVLNPAPLEYTPRKTVAALPPTSMYTRLITPSKQYQPSKLSASFSSVPDEELLLIADQVEEELSQKKLGKQRESPAAVKKSAKRNLPWVVNSLPPLSTQDYLLEVAEEIEDEMEAD